MRIISLSVIFVLLSVGAEAQNLLGYKPESIEKYIQKNQKELVREENNRNEHYKYLKYTDGSSGTTTVYFFLSDDNICNRIKRIHVHSLKDKVIEELDEKYESEGDNTWKDTKGEVDAIIKLINEEWFFTVNFEPLKKQ